MSSVRAPLLASVGTLSIATPHAPKSALGIHPKISPRNHRGNRNRANARIGTTPSRLRHRVVRSCVFLLAYLHRSGSVSNPSHRTWPRDYQKFLLPGTSVSLIRDTS